MVYREKRRGVSATMPGGHAHGTRAGLSRTARDGVNVRRARDVRLCPRRGVRDEGEL